MSRTETWAQAVAMGVPDDIYWRSTPVEVGALIDALADRESRRSHDAALRAGLIASVILNTHRRKQSDKVWKPTDFVRPPRERVEIVSGEEMKRRLIAWAEAHNRRLAAEQQRRRRRR